MRSRSTSGVRLLISARVIDVRESGGSFSGNGWVSQAPRPARRSAVPAAPRRRRSACPVPRSRRDGRPIFVVGATAVRPAVDGHRQGRRRRHVVVEDIVVHDLVVAARLAGRRVERDDGVGVEVRALAIGTVGAVGGLPISRNTRPRSMSTVIPPRRLGPDRSSRHRGPSCRRPARPVAARVEPPDERASPDVVTRADRARTKARAFRRGRARRWARNREIAGGDVIEGGARDPRR